MPTYIEKTPEGAIVSRTAKVIDTSDNPAIPITRFWAKDEETGLTTSADTEKEAYKKLKTAKRLLAQAKL